MPEPTKICRNKIHFDKRLARWWNVWKLKGLGQSQWRCLVGLPIKQRLMAFKRFINRLQSTPMPYWLSLKLARPQMISSLTVDYHLPSIGSDCGIVFQTLYDHLKARFTCHCQKRSYTSNVQARKHVVSKIRAFLVLWRGCRESFLVLRAKLSDLLFNQRWWRHRERWQSHRSTW